MRSRGSSREMLRRLWTRAPSTAMLVLGPVRAFLVVIVGARVVEGEFLDRGVASPGQERRGRGLAGNSGVCEIFARGGPARPPEVLLEGVLDVAARTDVARLAQILQQRREHLPCPR